MTTHAFRRTGIGSYINYCYRTFLAGIGKALGTSMREFKEEVNRNESDDEKKGISKDEKSEK